MGFFLHAQAHAGDRRRDADALLRVGTYNIHKGVRGVGLGRRLEIHNLEQALRSLQADLWMLQEVRLFHHRDARRFAQGPQAWPAQGQAEFLAPQGFHAAYRTNAVTRHGEHGNAVLSRWPIGQVGHHDVSDHRFEQRGLLHVRFSWSGVAMHAVVAHFGLMHASRVRQAEQALRLIDRDIPPGEPVLLGGDFNDWGQRLDDLFRQGGFARAEGGLGASGIEGPGATPSIRRGAATFPSRVPVFALDRIYCRGLRCVGLQVPRGMTWARLSDHLPLVAEFVKA